MTVFEFIQEEYSARLKRLEELNAPNVLSGWQALVRHCPGGW